MDRGIIDAMAPRFPKLPVQPGDYAVEWFLDDRVVPGELSVEPNRPPKAVLFGDVVPRDWSHGGGFPEEHSFDRVAGRLRSNLDVLLTDAHIAIWFPQHSLGSPGMQWSAWASPTCPAAPFTAPGSS